MNTPTKNTETSEMREFFELLFGPAFIGVWLGLFLTFSMLPQVGAAVYARDFCIIALGASIVTGLRMLQEG